MFDKLYSKKDLKLFCELANIEKCTKKAIKEYLDSYKFAPRYLRNLTDDEKYLKKFEIRFNLLRERHGKIKKSEIYKKTKSDELYLKKRSVKVSKYTEKWNRKYPNCKSIECKSRVSGVPKSILKKVANKGAGAWRGGSHRPGASRENWMVSRVNSFLLCGKTWEFPDHLLAKEALRSPKVKKFWKSCDKKKLGKKTPSR